MSIREGEPQEVDVLFIQLLFAYVFQSMLHIKGLCALQDDFDGLSKEEDWTVRGPHCSTKP